MRRSVSKDGRKRNIADAHRRRASEVIAGVLMVKQLQSLAVNLVLSGRFAGGH